MDFSNREITFEASGGEGRIFARIYEPVPVENVRAILQIAHGMAEHSARYQDFATYMAGLGFAVCIHDHAGHGRSVTNGAGYGYFGAGGYQGLVNDMDKLRRIVQADYPAVPYFLMGHSMGSFLTREYLAQYGAGVSGAVLAGTSAGMNEALMKGGRLLAEHLMRKKGPRAYDSRLQRLTTGQYDKPFAPNRMENEWLSRDEKAVERFNADPLCGFPFTTSGYRELIVLLERVNSPEWYRGFPYIPVFFIAGDKDPVGDFGKGVRKIARRLEKSGHAVTIKLYPGARHELLNETNKEEVYRDIHRFLERLLEGKQRKDESHET